MYREWKNEPLYEFEHLTSDNRKILVNIKEGNGQNWISIAQMKKWHQDGLFHFHKTICMEFDDFKGGILPALNDIVAKVDSENT